MKVGAAPWAQIRIDGVARGQTPHTFELAAGAHEIELTLPTASPPRAQTFRITVAADEERAVFADFSD
ncbi:MAG: PEGA domain-containing protein [Kofleriaceae bacterium]